jgi:hypothetical protein
MPISAYVAGQALEWKLKNFYCAASPALLQGEGKDSSERKRRSTGLLLAHQLRNVTHG